MLSSKHPEYTSRSVEPHHFEHTGYRHRINLAPNRRKNADKTITESVVEENRRETSRQYVESTLSLLSPTHRQLYNITAELSSGNSRKNINTGSVYQQYQEQTQNPLSNRRISDYLKQLEQHQLITADYHYGGSKSKTREIKINKMI